MASAGKPRRVDIGFQGGQAFAVRLNEDELGDLKGALESDRADRWHTITSEDSEVLIDLSQVVYVRVETEDHRVGF